MTDQRDHGDETVEWTLPIGRPSPAFATPMTFTDLPFTLEPRGIPLPKGTIIMDHIDPMAEEVDSAAEFLPHEVRIPSSERGVDATQFDEAAAERLSASYPDVPGRARYQADLEALDEIRESVEAVIMALKSRQPGDGPEQGRALSIAITNIETGLLWAEKALD